jgi:hypothetical protein
MGLLYLFTLLPLINNNNNNYITVVTIIKIGSQNRSLNPDRGPGKAEK